ncbi:MAG: hypothetical protein JW871_03780 [Endomicrobiales bacterium]|nr:hypothetical protein [Endomicrobiales bacterium]
MKKVTLLISQSKAENALLTLRQEGVLHVSYVKPPAAESIDELKSKLLNYEKAINVLPEGVDNQKEYSKGVDYTDITRSILTMEERRKRFIQNEKDIKDKIAEQKIWGSFSPRDAKMLNESGVFFKLYSCTKKEFKKIPEDKIVRIINQKGSIIYFVLVAREADEALPFNEISIPEKSLDELQEELKANTLDIKLTEKEISELAGFRDILVKEKEKLEKSLEFSLVQNSMGIEEGFSYMQGYCPVTRIKSLKQAASGNKWGLLVQDLDENEEAPVLLSDSFLSRVIKPVFDFMGTVPGYREYDISQVFLIFFSVFFAMLIGDAGYGLLFVLATFILRRKFSKAPAEPFLLFYILSFSTVIWGALSGTWFGYEKIAGMPFFKLFIVDSVNSYIDSNMENIIKLNFIIGLIQLSIAHLMVGLRLRKTLKIIGQLGWILVLWGLYFLAGNVVLNKQFPEIAKWLLISGAVLVILFSEFNRKNVIKGIFSGLGNLLNNFVNSFAHIVSYLRLFAVGYASVTIASSFNDMALSLGWGNILSGLGFALILLFGHGLNIVLGGMAVIVHGIRLNMLEFSGHLNMQWSGTEYKPFKG